MTRQGSYTATVSAVKKGRGGLLYAVAWAKGIVGSITFTLVPSVWTETRDPHEGEQIVLSELTKFRQGWRAFKAERQQPRSEQPQKPKKERSR